MIRILLIALLLIGCKEKKIETTPVVEKTELNIQIIQKLNRSLEVDQLAASNAYPPEN